MSASTATKKQGGTFKLSNERRGWFPPPFHYINMKNQIIKFGQENDVMEIKVGLSVAENRHIDKFMKKICVNSKSSANQQTYLREIMRFRGTTGKPFSKITDEDLDDYMILLGRASFGDHTFNKMVMAVKRFLKFTHKDWSAKFNNFESVISKRNPKNMRQKTEKNLINQEEAEELIKASPSLVRKTLLLVHKQTGARTGELVRGREINAEGRDCFPLEWDRVVPINNNRVRITLNSIKGGSSKQRTITLGSQAAHYLELWKKRQRKIKKKAVKALTGRMEVARRAGRLEEAEEHEKNIDKINSHNYVFTSERNSKDCETLGNYRLWFGELCELVLDRIETPYIFRHTLVTELDKKVKAGTMPKGIALEIMGHSEKMFDKVYSKITPNEVADAIEEHLFPEENIEYTVEEKMSLEEKMEAMQQKMEQMEKEMSMGQRVKEGKGKILKLKAVVN